MAVPDCGGDEPVVAEEAVETAREGAPCEWWWCRCGTATGGAEAAPCRRSAPAREDEVERRAPPLAEPPPEEPLANPLGAVSSEDSSSSVGREAPLTDSIEDACACSIDL